MSRIAIIGGSGLDTLAALEQTSHHAETTAYGAPSAPIIDGLFGTHRILFLPRHGNSHSIAPHRINYRANIAALKTLGVSDIIAVTAVGGIDANTPPGRIVIPDQIIDYTYGREQTFFDGQDLRVEHVDFTYPFSKNLRTALIDAATARAIEVEPGGVYGATQGPRLESAAEIERLDRDGCSIVGMTAMPEAALAREAEINYANCSLVVNWAAGKTAEEISFAEIEAYLESGMAQVVELLRSAVATIA